MGTRGTVRCLVNMWKYLTYFTYLVSAIVNVSGPPISLLSCNTNFKKPREDRGESLK